MRTTPTLSRQFQISVPKAVRDAQHWEPGQRFVFIPKGSGVLMMPVPSRDDLFGIAAGADPTGYRDREDRF